jgi:hypothetical protein
MTSDRSALPRGARRERRGEILAALERAGLTPPVCEAAYAAGVAIRERTIRTKREYAVLIEAKSGEPVDEPAEGEEDNVEIGAQFARCMPGRAYIGLHTHPHNRHFSLRDVSLLLRRHPALRAIVAITRTSGAWYVMSVEPGMSAPTIEVMRRAVEGVVEEIGERYGVPPFPDPAEARRALWHAVWSQIGPDLGLRYDRIEGR